MGRKKQNRTSSGLGVVHRLATDRNGRVEILIDFVLRIFAAQLHAAGQITTLHEPSLQKPFERDDCRDKFDHFLKLELAQPIGDPQSSGILYLWGQTTCYKGNDTGRAESNKTYELRETLTEALGLRRWLREEGALFRTVHFTVGPERYTYAWFATAKKCAFDLSVYLDETLEPSALFNELERLISNGELVEAEIRDRLREAVDSPRSAVAEFVDSMLAQLHRWFTDGLPFSPFADQQADLLSALRLHQSRAVDRALTNPLEDIPNIKGQVKRVLAGGGSDDAFIVRTVERLKEEKSFLVQAREALNAWGTWSGSHFIIPPGCSELTEYIRHLWNAPDQSRPVNRRLLLRIHSGEGVPYAQDGGDEHTQYGADLSTQQTQKFVDEISSACLVAGIQAPKELFERLASERGRQLLEDSLDHDSVNGTTMTPSRFYLEMALAEHYDLVPLNTTELPRPVGYHAAFGDAKVGPYTSMYAAVSKRTRQPVAILKAKFFSRGEFSRRAKEEAYVGFTARFQYVNGSFVERYPGIPLVMFVDVEPTCRPHEYAIKRLATAGWEVFFSINRLRDYLDTLQNQKIGCVQEQSADSPDLEQSGIKADQFHQQGRFRDAVIHGRSVYE